MGGAVPVGPIYGLAQAINNPRTADMVDTVAHHEKPGGMRVLANPIRIDGERLPNRAALKLGTDSDALLAEAGYDPAAIARLRANGIA